MRSLLLTLALVAASLSGLNAAVILGGPAIDPGFGTRVFVLTDAELNPVSAVLSGTNVIINTSTLEYAFLVEEGQLNGAELAVSPELNQFLLLTLILESFTGTTIDAVGSPLTPLSNSALLDVVGRIRLALTPLTMFPGPGGGPTIAYDVSSITQVAVPEPGPLTLISAGLLVMSVGRRFGYVARRVGNYLVPVARSTGQ